MATGAPVEAARQRGSAMATISGTTTTTACERSPLFYRHSASSLFVLCGTACSCSEERIANLYTTTALCAPTWAPELFPHIPPVSSDAMLVGFLQWSPRPARRP